MIDGKSILAVIPARGGSERLPKKNKLELLNKPLISWTIDAALSSDYIDEIVVSSDDLDIIEIAKEQKVKTLLRPDFLANKNASSFSVVEHVIDNLDDNFEYVALLQPTSPLRNSLHIDQALDLLLEKKADAIVSVCKSEHNPIWSNKIPEDGSMENFLDDNFVNKRSQDLPTYYNLNGAIYICDIKKLLSEKTFLVKQNVFSYKMDRDISIDIDYKLDFLIAEQIMRLKK